MGPVKMKVKGCLVVSGCCLLVSILLASGYEVMVPGSAQDRELMAWLKEFQDTIGGDPLFERLVSQIWTVHRKNLKDNSTMYGTQIDPIAMDEMMGPIDVPIRKDGLLPTSARIEGIEIHGLASMALERSLVKRKEMLDDLNLDVTFKFDKIFLNGTYRVETMGLWWIPGNHFSIHLSKCHLSYLAHLTLMDLFNNGTQPESSTEKPVKQNKCTKEEDPDVQLKNLAMPLDCMGFDFNFFGATDWLVEFLGLFVVREIVSFATNAAREQVNFLLCSGK